METSEILGGTIVVAVTFGGAYALGHHLARKGNVKRTNTALGKYIAIADQRETKLSKSLNVSKADNKALKKRMDHYKSIADGLATSNRELTAELQETSTGLTDATSRWEGYEEQVEQLAMAAAKAKREAANAKSRATRLKNKYEPDEQPKSEGETANA